jgi:hypothetical protein
MRPPTRFVILEYDANGTVISTGAPLQQTVIAVLRVRDDPVASHRGSINPLVRHRDFSC